MGALSKNDVQLAVQDAIRMTIFSEFSPLMESLKKMNKALDNSQDSLYNIDEIVAKDLYRETLKELFESPIHKRVFIDAYIKAEIEIGQEINSSSDSDIRNVKENADVKDFTDKYWDTIPPHIKELAYNKSQEIKGTLNIDEKKIPITNWDNELYNYIYLCNRMCMLENRLKAYKLNPVIEKDGSVTFIKS